jgi:peptide-methionine (R)-S-oxide reductase
MKTGIAIAVGLVFCGLLYWSRAASGGGPGGTNTDARDDTRLLSSYADFGPEQKVIRTEEQWRQLLSPGQFRITRRGGTEMAFFNRYYNLHEQGVYRCICCGSDLFSSAAKFDSGTGWPSFWAPISESRITNNDDDSLGVRRTEVLCSRCDAHLGHVFGDGPPPSHLRYCMNSAALRFVKY